MAERPDRASRDGWLTSLFLRIAPVIQRAPRWLKAPLIGAAGGIIVTVLRGSILLVSSPANPKNFGLFLLALVVAGGAGAVTGVVFNIVRIILRRLSFFGDILTGVTLGWTFILVVLLQAKFFFGDDLLATAGDWRVSFYIGAGLGLVGTILYWYDCWRYPS